MMLKSIKMVKLNFNFLQTLLKIHSFVKKIVKMKVLENNQK